MRLLSTRRRMYIISSNFMCHPHERLLGLFVFAESDPFLVCPKMEEQAAKEAGWTGDIIGYDDAEDPWVSDS